MKEKFIFFIVVCAILFVIYCVFDKINSFVEYGDDNFHYSTELVRVGEDVNSCVHIIHIKPCRYYKRRNSYEINTYCRRVYEFYCRNCIDKYTARMLDAISVRNFKTWKEEFTPDVEEEKSYYDERNLLDMTRRNSYMPYMCYYEDKEEGIEKTRIIQNNELLYFDRGENNNQSVIPVSKYR